MLLFKLRLSTLITAVVALALLAVAIDWNAQPGVALAQDIAKPSEPIASSSAGVMTVTWGATEGVTSGYQYRYSTNSLCLLVGADCDFVSTDNEDGTDKDWTNHGSAQDATTLTFPGEGDPRTPRPWISTKPTSSKCEAKRAPKRVRHPMFQTARTIGR